VRTLASTSSMIGAGKESTLRAWRAGQVENARLIAAHDAGGLDTCNRHGEAQAASEVAAIRNRQNHRQLGRLVELGGRNDQDGAAAALVMPRWSGRETPYKCRRAS